MKWKENNSDIQETGFSNNRYFLIIKSSPFVHFSDARTEFFKACGYIYSSHNDSNHSFTSSATAAAFKSAYPE